VGFLPGLGRFPLGRLIFDQAGDLVAETEYQARRNRFVLSGTQGSAAEPDHDRVSSCAGPLRIAAQVVTLCTTASLSEVPI
jgi:hypothetical protein